MRGCKARALRRSLSGGKSAGDPGSEAPSGRCCVSGHSAMALFFPSVSASSTSISKAEAGLCLVSALPAIGVAGLGRLVQRTWAMRSEASPIPAPPNPTEGLRTSLGSPSFLVYKVGMLMGNPLGSIAINTNCRKKSRTGRL